MFKAIAWQPGPAHFLANEVAVSAAKVHALHNYIKISTGQGHLQKFIMPSLFACRACHRSLIDAFISLNTTSVRSSTRHSSRKLVQSSQPLATSRSRSFQTAPLPLRQDAAPSASTVTSPETPSLQPSSALPWYLQVSIPDAPPSGQAQTFETHDLPPIPADAPAILEPILSHLSITTGLTNLALLDLRHLDPPAALGSNLLMIVGTARSHKHLNTSADRFCRWLRGTYKLRPYADGLLGRNEMKLKLRRRNKKLKLARTVGNTLVEKEEKDDGITTGWICCNLGIVDEEAMKDSVVASHGEERTEVEHVQYSQKDQERILEDEEKEYINPGDGDFVYRGFGSALNAPKIVVQMFTEEKRAEMDLEGLWQSRVVRREKKAELADWRAGSARDGEHFEDPDLSETEQEKLQQTDNEIDSRDAREGEDESKPLSGIGAS